VFYVLLRGLAKRFEKPAHAAATAPVPAEPVPALEGSK
jgi:hypothetical protein